MSPNPADELEVRPRPWHVSSVWVHDVLGGPPTLARTGCEHLAGAIVRAQLDDLGVPALPD